MKQLIIGAVILLAALTIKAQTFVIHTDSSFQEEGTSRSKIVAYKAVWTVNVGESTVQLESHDIHKTFPIIGSKAIGDASVVFTLDMGNDRKAVMLVSGNLGAVIMGDEHIKFYFRVVSIDQLETIKF